MDAETEFALFELDRKFSRQLLEYRLARDDLCDQAEIERIQGEQLLIESLVGIHSLIESVLDGLVHQSGGTQHAAGQANQMAVAIQCFAADLRRIANHFDPPPPDIVDSPYVARLLDCTTTWVADMARHGEIPKSCLVPGTGNGRPWKFYRTRIEQWIRSR